MQLLQQEYLVMSACGVSHTADVLQLLQQEHVVANIYCV